MKYFALLLIFQFSYFVLFAQTITFCTSINSNDQCADKPKRFYIEPGKGAYVYAVVNLLEEVNTTKVYYKIFYIDKAWEEVYITTLSQDVLPRWKSFWKQLIFTTEVSCKIYVYNDSDKLLTSGSLFVKSNY